MTDGGVPRSSRAGFRPRSSARSTRRGHDVRVASGEAYGGYQAILRDPDGVYFGATESRKDGQAAGW